ncbi:MAG: hypothetical protein JW896_09360 [Deltaproteobacteria bacterium]|nr:hypothetical protein [Deltaproteobacteria bacterium]
MSTRTDTSNQSRIRLTQKILEHYLGGVFKGNISALAREKGLPYTLVYNLICGRIKSLSLKDYRILFGEEPPPQDSERVNGDYFRGMVRLWLFFNEDISRADLYRELYPTKKTGYVDYRIFHGKVKSVKAGVERIMEKKFLDHGFERSEIKKWIEEYDLIEDRERVLYEEIKPLLDYLKGRLGINPSQILNQWYNRYESGELKTVSKKIYNRALDFKNRAEKALRSGFGGETERLKDEIRGKKNGFDFFSEVEEELDFLKRYGGRSPKKYLGRSISHYKGSRLKRIATWRAQRIRDDCCLLVENRPDLKLSSIPKSCLKKRGHDFLRFMRLHTITRLAEDEAWRHEKEILTPNSFVRDAYDSEKHGFIRIDHASFVLGMGKTAFDLMVSAHSDLFRTIGKYDEKTRKWYVPNLYLKELLTKQGFFLIKNRYTSLSKEPTIEREIHFKTNPPYCEYS